MFLHVGVCMIPQWGTGTTLRGVRIVLITIMSGLGVIKTSMVKALTCHLYHSGTKYWHSVKCLKKYSKPLTCSACPMLRQMKFQNFN